MQTGNDGARGTLSLTRGDWPVELAQNGEWRRASLGDEWALLGVAQQRQSLKTQLETGGPAAGVAVRAWPLASTAWVERGNLCRALLRYPAQDWGSLLAALRHSRSVEDAFGEVLDVDAESDCENMLTALDGLRSEMPPSVFDEYVAACQALGRAAPTQRRASTN